MIYDRLNWSISHYLTSLAPIVLVMTQTDNLAVTLMSRDEIADLQQFVEQLLEIQTIWIRVFAFVKFSSEVS